MITQEHITKLIEAVDNEKIICIAVFCKGFLVSSLVAYGDDINFTHDVGGFESQPMLNFNKVVRIHTLFGSNDTIWIDDDDDIEYEFCLRGKKLVKYCNGEIIHA